MSLISINLLGVLINFHARKWFLRVLENSLGPVYYSNTLEKRYDILNQQTKRNQTRKTFNGATMQFFSKSG